MKKKILLASWMRHAQSWLQKMQDIEFATLNDWIQRIRNRINDAATPGNGQFVRAISNIIVYQEAMRQLVPFIRQRSRWVQGGLDCTGKYMSPIFHSEKIKFLGKM